MKYLFLVVVLIFGCGDDADKKSNNANNQNSDDPCNFETALSGEVEQEISWGQSQGCGAATSGSLVTFTFGVLGDESIIVGITGGEPGTTADGLDAYFTYRMGDDEWTTNDCILNLTRNEVIESDPDFGDTYALEGDGSCASPATGSLGDATGEIEIGDFEFGASAPWRTTE